MIKSFRMSALAGAASLAFLSAAADLLRADALPVPRGGGACDLHGLGQIRRGRGRFSPSAVRTPQDESLHRGMVRFHAARWRSSDRELLSLRVAARRAVCRWYRSCVCLCQRIPILKALTYEKMRAVYQTFADRSRGRRSDPVEASGRRGENCPSISCRSGSISNGDGQASAEESLRRAGDGPWQWGPAPHRHRRRLRKANGPKWEGRPSTAPMRSGCAGYGRLMSSFPRIHAGL